MSNQVLLGQAQRSIVLKGSKETEERYERELAAAEADRKKAEAEFRAAGAVRIKEIKRRIGELSAEIRQAAPEQKRTLGEEIKKLNAEIESLKTPPANRFAYLDSEIKAYAGSQLLFKPLLSPQTLAKYGVAFSFNRQGRLVLDADELRESPLGDKIRSGADYIFERTRELGGKITRAADVNNIVLMDAKRLLSREPEEIDFELIEECHNAFNAEKAEREKKNKELARRREESRTGIRVIKEYPDGYSMVEMLPSPVYDENGKLLHHVSLKYESDEMGHCVGRGGYNDRIGTEGWHFYSLRGPNEDGVLVPHCTISIENGRLAQIKGNSNLAVKNRYVADVRDFVQSLDMPIPDSEKERIGYVKDVNRREVDLFDLQPGTELESLKLAAGDYKGIRLQNVARVGRLSFEGKVDLRDYREAAAIGRIDSLTLETAEDAALYDQVPLNAGKLLITGGILPRHLGRAETVALGKDAKADFSRDWENVRRLELNGETVLDARRLPVFAEGIKGGVWHHVENLTTFELLNKMLGSEWTAAHCRVENGKTIVDADLDLSGRGLVRLPSDMKNTVVLGTLDLSDNRLDDVSAPLAYPDCERMVLRNGFGVYNPDRFEALPYLAEGIDCRPRDVYLEDRNLAEVLDKFALIDRARIKNENGRFIIDGDLDLDSLNTFDGSGFPGRNIENIEVTGRFTALPEMTEYPSCRTLCLRALPQDVTVSDQTEKVVFLPSREHISRLKGKNLKRVVFNDCYLTCADLHKFDPGVSYEGTFYLKDEPEAEKPAMRDFSGLRFEGMLTISGTCNIEGISRLPHCKKVNFHGRVTEKELLILHPETEELLCPDTFDLDMLPAGSRLKYISLNSNFYHRKKEEYTDFLRRASERGIVCGYGIEPDLSQDLSDCLLKKVELRWDEKHKDISTLPQAEELCILSPAYGFDNRFLKDASSSLKVLDLSYMRGPVDFSALPRDVALRELSLGDSPMQNDILGQLPKSLESIRFLRCSGNPDLEPINRMPNLQRLDVSQMTLPADALDRIDPDRLAALEVSGDTGLVMRAEEIVAICRLPPSKENDQIRKMHEWLTTENKEVPYFVRQVVFYGTAGEILSGKHPQAVTAEEIAARVKGVENFMLDNCAKIIMAEERGHKTGSEKAGRAVLGENKGKKLGFYGHVTGYYTHSPDISKAGKIVRSVLTRSIRHHPDFAKAEELVAGRLSAHARNLQLNFNRQLTDRGQTLKAYVNAARYNQGNAGFNAAVRKMHEYKRYG